MSNKQYICTSDAGEEDKRHYENIMRKRRRTKSLERFTAFTREFGIAMSLISLFLHSLNVITFPAHCIKKRHVGVIQYRCRSLPLISPGSIIVPQVLEKKIQNNTKIFWNLGEPRVWNDLIHLTVSMVHHLLTFHYI